MTIAKSIQTSTCTISLREDGIYEYRFIDEYQVDKAAMDEIIVALEEIAGGQTGLRLVTIPGRYGSIAPDAKTYDPMDTRVGLVSYIGLVLPSLHQKILARAYYKLLKKPAYSYKFFKTEEDAIAWLKEVDVVKIED